MGGRGGGGWSTLGDISSLEEKAKAALREGRRNAFISFAHEDTNEVNLLRAQAKNEKSDIEFNDHSVKEPFDSERAEYIRQKITEKIRRTSVCLVYLSEHTAISQWVTWEVEKCIELGKRVVAVHSGDSPPTSLPSWVKQYAIKVTPWSNLSEEIDSPR